MESTTMDSTGMKALVEAQEESVTLLEEEGAAAIGEEEITWTLASPGEEDLGVDEADRRGFDWVMPSPCGTIFK